MYVVPFAILLLPILGDDDIVNMNVNKYIFDIL